MLQGEKVVEPLLYVFKIGFWGGLGLVLLVRRNAPPNQV